MKLPAEIVDQVAHDLRNPLNTIAMAAALLERAAHDDSSKQSVERIQRAGERLAAMIDELVDYARIQMGQLEVVSEPAELGALLDEALEELDEPQRARVTREGTLPLPLKADSERVPAALRAIVNDALLRGEGPVVIRAASEGKLARVTIARPQPIAPAVLKKLFEPSVKHPRRRPPRDLVFGLFVARAVIAALGGELTATADAFELTLPK
jgi:signal transduction histidine kinase